MPDRRRISKLLSLILRHRPNEFGLNMDEYGYIPLDEVVEAVQERYSAVEEEDIRELVETSRQRRFEISDKGIRALYAHSFYVEMDGQPMDPPELLYMCVTGDAARRMAEEGIRPEDRFYLHLSPTREVAESRSSSVTAPHLVEVRAEAAFREAGIEFWERGDVILTREVPQEYVGETIELEVTEAPEDQERRPRRPRRDHDSKDRGDRPSRDRGPRGRGGSGDSESRERATSASAPIPGPAPGTRLTNDRSESSNAGPQEMTYGRHVKFESGNRRR